MGSSSTISAAGITASTISTSSTIAASGLVTCNAGLLMNNASGITAYLITAQGPVTCNAGISATTIAASGAITCNGGLIMGANDNITLTTGSTLPTSGQLGYVVSGSLGGSPTSTTAGNVEQAMSLTIPAGTYMVTVQIIFDANTSAYTKIILSTGSAIMFNGDMVGSTATQNANKVEVLFLSTFVQHAVSTTYYINTQASVASLGYTGSYKYVRIA
jgi:hypothetical protein